MIANKLLCHETEQGKTLTPYWQPGQLPRVFNIAKPEAYSRSYHTTMMELNS